MSSQHESDEVDRRTVIKGVAVGAVGLGLSGGLARNVLADDAPAAAGSSGAGGSSEVPAYAGKLGISDMTAKDADGKPQAGFAHTSSTAQQVDPKAPYQMPLTQDEQDILDGKKGPELAKVMKIVVAHGSAFGAPKLVDLGGAPHCSM